MTTSPSEILAASAVVSSVVIAVTLLRSTSKFVHRDIVRLRKKSKSEDLESIPDEAIASSFKSHFRSLPGIAISLIAPGVYIAGLALCSILRDHGQDIFWLPMLGVCLMAGLAGYTSILLHDRVVLKKLSVYPTLNGANLR